VESRRRTRRNDHPAIALRRESRQSSLYLSGVARIDCRQLQPDDDDANVWIAANCPIPADIGWSATIVLFLKYFTEASIRHRIAYPFSKRRFRHRTNNGSR
jgi:hypothetical protein